MPPTNIAAAHRILDHVGVPVRTIEPFADGNINEVYRVNGDRVLRFASDPAAGQRLEREAALIADIDGLVPTRKVISVGQFDGFTYQILGYVEGVSLADYWPGASEREKAAVAEHLAGALRRLHSRTGADFGYFCLEGPSYGSWRELLTSRFEEVPEKTREHAFTADIGGAVDQMRAFVAASAPALDPSPEPRFLHHDLVLNNAVIGEGGAVTLIDFELSARGPIDAELMPIEFFCDNAELLGRPDAYRDFPPMLDFHYPELYKTPNVETRLGLYELSCHWQGLVHELSRCKEGRCKDEPHAFPDFVVQRSQAIYDGKRR